MRHGENHERLQALHRVTNVSRQANRRIPVSHKYPPGDLNLWPLWQEANRLVHWTSETWWESWEIAGSRQDSNFKHILCVSNSLFAANMIYININVNSSFCAFVSVTCPVIANHIIGNRPLTICKEKINQTNVVLLIFCLLIIHDEARRMKCSWHV